MTITRREALYTAGALAAAGVIPVTSQEAQPSPVPPDRQGDSEAVCLTDFEPLAKAKIPAAGWEYIVGGAADEETLHWNREAYQRIQLKPRVLVDVSKLDTRITLFGQEQAFPILLAPTAAHKLVHPEGEIATVGGASSASATMVLSSFSTISLEEVAAAARTPLWFQIYSQADRGFTRELVERAQNAGYRALCLTVDTPVSGARNREARAHVALPNLPNLCTLKLSKVGEDYRANSLDIFSSVLNPRLSWRDVEWLQSFAKVPLLIKGVLNPEDADRAAKSGVGIIVSNHGGRNLDTVPATIDALPRVTEKVAGRVPVLVDGGIRRGTDVLKALAFGANAVFIGRPYLFGLGAAGRDGVAQVLRILQRELQFAMALTGRPTIASIDRSVIWS